jgi:hypothetical protein
MPRHALVCALLAACHGSHPTNTPDGPPSDAPPADGSADAGDTTAPQLVLVTPPTWLHEATRLDFDEPLDPTSLANVTAAVTLAGTPLSSRLVLDGDRTIAVVVDPAARGLGELAVHLAGSVRDLAGNAGPVTADTSATLAAWSSLPVDLGAATSSPALAVTALGGVVAAWIAGSQVVVARLDRGVWQPLGTPLGAASASSPALALDDAGAPLAGWIEGGVAHVARWDGAAWQDLPSPGSGTAIALAAPAAGGAPVVAVFGTGATIATLAGGAWQPLGASVALSGFTCEPQLAAASTDRAAIAWIDPAGTLRVARWNGAAWTALAPIALGLPPTGCDRASIAARDDTIAIAWDQWAGSRSVLAAEASGAATTWTRLGHLLDVDIDSDATAPAIALDASDRAIVAWTELIETAQRGVIAHWSGAKWTIVGGPTWLADATSTPTRAALALGAGDVPVVGASSAGALDVARFDGPAVAGPGLDTRATLAGCAFSAASPPALLSQTGCFTIAPAGHATPHPGLVPYDVVNELWTDGAKKRRWIALPDGASMTTLPTGAWNPPAGTFIVKEFALETTPGNPATRRAIETRVLFKDASAGWQGFSYRWNAAGTDAMLQTDGEYVYGWPMDDGSTHNHFYPSRSECLSCHQSTYGPLLGLRAPQLARWFDYDGVIADQPTTLEHLGVHAASNAAPFISPQDPSETWEHRMRGYMAANCAHCHNPQDIAIHDLRYTTPLAQTNLCPDIAPGNPSGSKVYQLVSSRPGMPPLGTLAVDPLAVQLLGNWITGMTSCP